MEPRTSFGRHEATPTTKANHGMSPAAIFTRGDDAFLGTGSQWKFQFDNGYGASVIDDGYGAGAGLYELAVIGPDGALNYDTPVTDDVLGWLTAEDVAEALDKIEAL